MELHQLRYFRAVAQFGSFTRAAEHERVAQPSLSQQIRKLEDDLGARLFNRLRRKVTLTPFGERFQEHARRVLAELEDARLEIEEIQGLRRGRVTLGAIPTVAPYLLAPLLRSFAAVYPQVLVTVTEDLTNSLLARLAEGELDLALLSLPVPGGDFIAEPVVEDHMLLALPKRHRLLRRPRRLSFRDVADEPFLLLREGHCFRNDVLNLCKNARLSPNVVFEGGQFETLLAMAAAGFGITVLPEMGRERFRRAGVGLVEFAAPEPHRSIGIVRWRGNFLTPAARALLESATHAFPNGRFASGTQSAASSPRLRL
ncbi:MAG TPA: LysR family transcriptional regulator [Terriglobia bacterium]|nr:LysR family transcriptional regulator [Terriglobia bacterium]